MGLSQAKSQPLPMNKGLRLDDISGSPLSDPTQYRRVVGKLLYLNMTRPDITFAVKQLSQHLQASRSLH